MGSSRRAARARKKIVLGRKWNFSAKREEIVIAKVKGRNTTQRLKTRNRVVRAYLKGKPSAAINRANRRSWKRK